MNTKIAVFGRPETIDRVVALTEGYVEIEILPFSYSHSREVPELVERAFMCDVYLFTGSLSYIYAKDKIKRKSLPAVHIAHDEYMILTSFYRLRNIFNQELDRISIDIFNGKYLREVAEELGFEGKSIYSYSFGKDPQPDIDQIANFHKKNWEEGKIDNVLTCSREVESHMKDAGIPVICMSIPDINIKRAIEQAKSLTDLKKTTGTQLVTGYIRIKESETESEDNQQSYEQNLYHLKDILAGFAQRTDSFLSHNRNDQFVLVGTKKLLDHLQNHYRDFPLMREIGSTIDMTIDMGFGLGLTAKESEAHALLAMEKCGKDKRSLSYIVNERKDIIGPIGIKRDIDTSRLFHELIHKARLNNELSYNFIDFITERNNEPFSSNDIASYYKVTKRSAERTVNKLLSGDVIKVSGEERPYLKGRPRKLFTLNQ
ncbi:hypothetical protein [Oceanobacillus damuensis]|uniref:hypothetical protein n=1 Tax=Oceanobacillus damuensis TaxID=937928 RepID=UPI00083598A7|nr:hypothetical protein [Oceanobacillus damuensis]